MHNIRIKTWVNLLFVSFSRIMAHKKEQKQARVLNNRLPVPYLIMQIREETIINFCFLPLRTRIFPTFIISNLDRRKSNVNCSIYLNSILGIHVPRCVLSQ